MPALTTREYLEQQIVGMKDDRAPFEGDWAEIGRLCLPNKVDIIDPLTASRTRNKRRANTTSHDTGGRIAARRLTNGMATGMTSASRPWYGLTAHDPDLAEFQPVKEWLAATTAIINMIFARTNYYDATKMQYADLGTMGIGSVLGLEHPDYMAVWHHMPVGSYFISLNEGLRANRLVRYTLPTVEQVVISVGGDWNRVTSQVKNAYDKSNYMTIVPCVSVIERNHDAKGQRLSPGILKPWRSIKWEVGQSDKKILLSEKGFDNQPFTAPRWETVGDQVYCDTSPGFDALPDMRELQLSARNKGRASANLVKPALAAPAGLARSYLTLDPGTINYIDGMSGDVIKPLLQTDPRTLEFIGKDIETQTRRVNELFYADLFMAITQMEGVQPRNMEELSYRNEEKLTQLGPVVDRVNIEKLEGDIERAYTIAKNLGLLPPIPPDLERQPLQIEFISILSLAQKAGQNTAIERAARFVGFVAALFPDAKLKFDAEQAIDEYAAGLGTSPKIIRSDEMVAELKKQMAQQQATDRMAALAQPTKDASQAAQILSETRVDPDGPSALQRILGQ